MKEVTPGDALKILQDDPNAIYLDVRSIPEFEKGHPIRAINIPLLHFQPGLGMMPNDQFMEVVQGNLPKAARILIGCQSGGRSARACEILSQSGYQDVSNVLGGFGGSMDMTGRVIDAGWSQLKLPVCTGCEDNSDYQSLSAKAKM